MTVRLDPVGHLPRRELEHAGLVLRVLGPDGIQGTDTGWGDGYDGTLPCWVGL